MDVACKGHKIAYIRSVDSDITVLALYHYVPSGLEKLFVGYGTGSKFRVILIHDCHQSLGQFRSEALLLFWKKNRLEYVGEFRNWIDRNFDKFDQWSKSM